MAERDFDAEFREIVTSSLPEYIPRVLGEIDFPDNEVSDSVAPDSNDLWERKMAAAQDEIIFEYFRDQMGQVDEDIVIEKLTQIHKISREDAWEAMHIAADEYFGGMENGEA